MRELYRKWSQQELSTRPVSRRTALTWGVGAPLAIIASGAVGFRRILPGGSAFQPPVVAAAVTQLESALESISAVAWVAKGAKHRDLLEKLVKTSLPPEGQQKLTLDSISYDTLMSVFRDLRTRVETQMEQQPNLSNDDLLIAWGASKVDCQDYADSKNSSPLPFTLSTSVSGWVGDEMIDIPFTFRGVAASSKPTARIEKLVRA